MFKNLNKKHHVYILVFYVLTKLFNQIPMFFCFMCRKQKLVIRKQGMVATNRSSQ
jgi:hypothetical protein